MSACSTDLTVNTGLILGRSGAAGAADASRYSDIRSIQRPPVTTPFLPCCAYAASTYSGLGTCDQSEALLNNVCLYQTIKPSSPPSYSPSSNPSPLSL